CFNQNYLDKLLDLDGAGHGFNVAVTENALKWDAWEEQWIGSPDETRNAIECLNDHHIETRGHTLIWPGWDHMPDDMQQNRTNLAYLTDRINERIETMLTDATIGKFITEWDVLNEITLVRDLEMAFSMSPEYQTGRELYAAILQGVTELKPNHLNYINDFVVFSGAGGLSATVERYHSYIEEILATDGAKLDGIGFQSHIGMSPISIFKVEETLNDFYNRYTLRMKVTEYDINKQVAPKTQAAYMSDFLTIVFSHPGMDAFLMWGFWDGNHWLDNAPIFNQDWSIKPSGQAFIDKVFEEWWTNEEENTSADGTVTFRPFKGQHKISIEHNGNVEEHIVHTSESDTMVIQLGTTSTHFTDEAPSFLIAPNPSPNGRLSILTDAAEMLHLDIYSIDGKLVRTYQKLSPQELILTHLEPGSYFAKISSETKTTVARFVIQ
ncbi:MAG: T9SS type A sorting domain-containing protein, partial [Saprospiraceae bacterium]|nr:T9SS type A sorting domain-containing protein [Saprospiraceae bacterium]